MTLNSISFSIRIIYRKNNKKYIVKIGKFIDELMEKYENKIIHINNNTKTDYLNITNLELTIETVDAKGNVSWKPIEAVTRHLPGGNVVKVTTSSGKEVIATKAKSFLIRKNNEIIEIEGSKLKIGDELPIKKDDTSVYYEQVVSIIDDDLNVFDSHSHVYDLTVAETRNFIIENGLCMRDTFHQSGVGVGGMQGIPRFREIISYTKDIQTPIMVIKLIKDIRSDPTMAHRIEAYLKHTIFGNLVEHMEIIFDPKPVNISKNDNIDTTNAFFLTGSTTSFENLPWLYKFVISRESMLEYDINLLDIKTKFVSFWESYTIESSAAKKKSVIAKVVNGSILSNHDNSPQPIIHIRLDINDPDNNILIEIGQYLLNKISIKGVKTIEKVNRVNKQNVIDYLPDGSVKRDTTEYVINTAGIDLNKIKTIKYIDFNTTYINDIKKTYINFGIEAARSIIINEIAKAYTGNDINLTHIELLADVMTNTGNITSIDRHGINRLDTDPLSRASFEKTVEQLLMAAAFNEIDHMRSVSSRIMAGRCIKGGTGLCDLQIDNEMFENSEYTKQLQQVESRITRIDENKLINDVIQKEEVDIFVP